MFLDIAIFRGAETFNQYTKKGSKILLRGSLELDQWQDQQGQKRQKHKMNVEEFTFLDSKQDNQQQQNYNAPRQQHSQTNTQMRNDPQYQQNLNKGQEIANNHNNYEQNIPVIDIDNDEIPFNED